MTVPNFLTQDNTTYKTNIDAALPLNKKHFNIGDWDMDASAFVAVSHGVDPTKIRVVTASIQDDSSARISQISAHQNGTASPDGTPEMWMDSVNTGGTTIILRRKAAGFYDANPDYNATSFNRGWITIEYAD